MTSFKKASLRSSFLSFAGSTALALAVALFFAKDCRFLSSVEMDSFAPILNRVCVNSGQSNYSGQAFQPIKLKENVQLIELKKTVCRWALDKNVVSAMS